MRPAPCRHLGIDETAVTPGFVEKMIDMLRRDGRPPQLLWNPEPNPHLAFVHDIHLPIPLYHFRAVVDEIEAGYEKVAADPRRSYNLHIDYHWEQTLRNLNPAKDKMSASWPLNSLLDGLLFKVIRQSDAAWVWGDDNDVLGTNLASVLYRLGEYYRDSTMWRAFDQRLGGARAELPAEVLGAY